MARPLAKLLLLFCGIVAALLVGSLIFALTSPKPALPSMPNPNGYSDFVEAGKNLAGDFSGYRTLPEPQLRSLLLTNGECLKRVRTGLTRQCRVPLDYSPGLSTHFSELPLLKRLAFALAAEGRLAELENRPTDAVRAYLDGLRFSQEAVRGGVIIDALVGVAIEAIHTQQLEKLSPTLGARDCRDVATALEEIECHRQTPTEVLQQERIWVRRAYGFRGILQRLLSLKSIRSTERSLVTRVNTQQTRSQALLVSVAARACELEEGRPPQSFADLVPAYLKTVPQDPRTGTNVVWPR